MNNVRILILNDDELTCKSLYEFLCRHGYAVDICASERDAVAHLEKVTCHIVLAETKNIDFIKTIRKKLSYSPEVIMLTSYGNVEAAVNSIKVGAFDYLVRPIDDKKILFAIERALASMPAIEAHSQKTESQHDDMFPGLVGKSAAINEIYSVIKRISNSKATILLRGESGTGKRLVARAIHNSDKKRREKMFVEVSGGALPREIIESELFGHTKGSFTGAICDRKGRFELAHGGTILLDEVDAMPLDIQVKLLRVLQQKEFERVGDNKTLRVDVRIIASTNQDLEKTVATKAFREDLYYRLNVISIHIPPLRDRKEDLPLLIEHFIVIYAKENNKKIKGMSKEAMDTLIRYNWPGNVRELENIIERAVILDTDNNIDTDDLPEMLNGTATAVKDQIIPTSLKDMLKEPEKVHILKVLEEVGWNKKTAAKKLGLNRTTLYNKLRKYDLLAVTNKK